MYSGQLNGTTSYAAGATLQYIRNGGLNPSANYNTGNMLFTSFGKAYVEVTASACINGASAGSMSVYVIRTGSTTETSFLFSTPSGFGNQMGSGSCIFSCEAGDTLSIATTTAFTAMPFL